MTRDRYRPCRRRTEQGLTLIELLVAIIILGVGVVAMTASLGNAEKLTGIASDQAKLEATMRQITDYLRSPTYVTYVLCASGYSIHDTSNPPKSNYIPTGPPGGSSVPLLSTDGGPLSAGPTV